MAEAGKKIFKSKSSIRHYSEEIRHMFGVKNLHHAVAEGFRRGLIS